MLRLLCCEVFVVGSGLAAELGGTARRCSAEGTGLRVGMHAVATASEKGAGAAGIKGVC